MKSAHAPFPLSALAALLATLSFPGLALAEDEAPAVSTKLDTVVITADRRAENIKRVPSSVTAIGGGKLEDLSAARIDDFVGLVPGLNFVGARPGNRQIVLRGISSGGDQQNATVATYIDDVPVGSSTSLAGGGRNKPDIDAFDLDRIEVLRGPQGTLYGANSLGGLLKYVTAQPDAKTFSGYGRAEVMSAAHGGNGYGLNAGLNAPLGKDAALRVSIFDRSEPGYIDNMDSEIGRSNVNKLTTRGARIAYAAKPTADFNIRASLLTQQFKTDGEPTEDISLATGQPVVGKYQQQRYTPEKGKQSFDLYSLAMDWAVGGGTLLSVTSLNDIKYVRGQDWTVYDGLGYNDPSVTLANEQDTFRTRKTTQEFRYTSAKSDAFEWMVGAFYTREKSRLFLDESGLTSQTTIAAPPYDILFTEETLSTYTQSAVYGNGRVYLTPKFDVALGLRYAKDKTAATDVGGGLFNDGSYDLSQGSSYTNFMVAPRYQLDAKTMIYARAASANRPGGPNALPASGITAGAQQIFNQDKLTSYELGYKTTALNGQLGIDLSAFYIDWKDIQIRSTVGTFAFIGNGGKAKSQGLEIALSASPVEDLQFTMNAAYTDAKLTSDALAVGGLAGEALPNSARFTAGASADYEFPAFGSARGYMGASVRHVGDRLENFVRGRGRDRLTLPAYDTLDLRAGLRWDKWDLNFYVKNATDTHIVETLTTNFSPASAAIGRPRTFGMSVTVRY